MYKGGVRYIIQNHQDAMAICKWAGYPELFITFTCNPKWPEVVRFVESRGLKPEDRPDILCRIFKVKLDQLVKDLRQNKIFGKVKAVDEDGYSIYRRRDNRRTIEKNGIASDNRYVIPHNCYLLLKYGAHMNVEWCNQSRSIKYISPCEAVRRIFGFDIHYRDPPVERLNFHLPNERNIVFLDTNSIDSIMKRNTVSKSMFSAWMDANKKYVEARELTYAEFPTRFVRKSSEREWHPSKCGFAIGRMFFVPPGCGDMYYLRTLLSIVRGPRNFEEIMNINGIQYNSLRDACYALGLLDDDKEYVDAIAEASHWGSTHYLRNLFATLLLLDSLKRLEFIWEQSWWYRSDNILYKQRSMLHHQDLHLTDEEIKNYTLLEIEKILRNSGKSLHDFPMMHFLGTIDVSCCQNRFIQDELRYDRIALAEDHKKFVSNLTAEQKSVYETIMGAVEGVKPGIFFVYGYGGTGKTFIWKTLLAALRLKGKIVLTIASNGIASFLLPGGRTAHSRFAIPLAPNEDSTCNVKQGSPFAELIVKTELIIWDEAPMMNRYCFEALDRTMRDILRFSNPLSLSNLLEWTKNMRLQSIDSDIDKDEMKAFSERISSIGDGTIGGLNDGHSMVDIPDDLLIKDTEDSAASIVNSMYLSFSENINDPSYLQERAILALTLDIVESINDYVSSLNRTEENTYLSSDATCRSDSNIDFIGDLHTSVFLNAIKCFEVPNHQLKLKVGVPVMLLRNVDHSSGLCNGTRLVITRLGNHVLEGKVISGSNAGFKVFIPTMTLTPSDPRLYKDIYIGHALAALASAMRDKRCNNA
ncbi:hypothetical protein FEM48_Zijuj04G0118400 [Ziziphus jujuba var. spinosa]|uniref:ATP-dependent DNA helicase n=1 Tax=Ziziphus jujuba var. spinosa TaxID=714518 RepID=A0A978VJQ2_ZIZJJ|nr:hypothetical protein FEM48_Zijuj04G0118400 [Ziziphus jujuba var. spinosa]